MAYPANSAGDLFRLLPFDGYLRVLSFLPVKQLPCVSSVSKGWNHAVGEGDQHDLSISCTTTGHLKTSMALLPRWVSALSIDISSFVLQLDEEEFWCLGQRAYQHVEHVTWRCRAFLPFYVKHIHDAFPVLRSLNIEFAISRQLIDLHLNFHMTHLSLESIQRTLVVFVFGLLGLHSIQTNAAATWMALFRLRSVVCSEQRSVCSTGKVKWTGAKLPSQLRSLHLQGVYFIGISLMNLMVIVLHGSFASSLGSLHMPFCWESFFL